MRKRFLLIALLILAVPLTAAAQTRSNGAAQRKPAKQQTQGSDQSLKDAEHQWSEAFENRDKVALDRILASSSPTTKARSTTRPTI